MVPGELKLNSGDKYGIRVKARYENKVLKPLEGLDLKEGGMWR